MNLSRLIVLPLILFGVCCAESLAQQVRSNESVQIVPAANVLDQSLLRGAGYAIDDQVQVQGNRYLFRIETDYGDVNALGLPMLELRLREHAAIQNARTYAHTAVAIEGIVDSVKKTPEGARTLLRDPLGSLSRIPGGIKSKVDSVVNPLERRAGSEARRKIAVMIGADPETRNPVLKRSLNQLALRKSIGEIGTQVGLQTILPGLGLLATNEDIRRQVSEYGPMQIAADVNQRMLALNVRADIAKSFSEDQHLTSAEKLSYVYRLERLRGVAGLDILVHNTISADSEASMLSQLQIVSVLGKLHRERPIRKIHQFKVPIAELFDGNYVGTAAVDLVDDTQELSKYIAEFRKSVPEKTVSLLVTGTITQSARAKAEAANINVYELAERPKNTQR